MPRTIIDTAIPYPLIWDSGEIDVCVDAQTYGVAFERRFRTKNDDDLVLPAGIPGTAQATNMELRFDRQARMAFTRLHIACPAVIDGSTVVTVVHRVANRLLDVYRFSEDEFYIDTIPRNEIWPYRLSIQNDDLSIRPEMSFSLDFGYGATTARVAAMPQEAMRLLTTGEPLPVWTIVWLNARREELLENYRVAVVEAETAFETLVAEIVAKHYQDHGLLDEADVENKLGAGLKNVLKDHLPKCCGQTFVGTPEHASWELKLYDLRNAVVHRGASVDKQQAREALVAGQAALFWLRVNRTN